MAPLFYIKSALLTQRFTYTLIQFIMVDTLDYVQWTKEKDKNQPL